MPPSVSPILRALVPTLVCLASWAGLGAATAGELGTAIGAGAGGAAGAAIGKDVGGASGAVIGGAIGGALGGGAMTSGSGRSGAVVGGAIGGAAGAAVGQQVGGSTGAVVGAGAGGALGAEIGRSMATQQRPAAVVSPPSTIHVGAPAVVVQPAHPGKGPKHKGRPPGRALGWDKNHRH